jgi:hypothetical protein
MKAIVTNLILGSVAYVLSHATPAEADVYSQPEATIKTPANLSAKALENPRIFLLPPTFTFEAELFDYSISLENKEYIKNLLQQENSAANQNIFNLNSKSPTNSLKKNPYIDESDREDVIFGKHNTFWHSKEPDKYWGLTTVKTWGDDRRYKHLRSTQVSRPHKSEDSSLQKLDYIYTGPVLAPDTAALTVSGGSKENLVQTQNALLGDKTNFQGGVAFHQSLAEEVTVGLGFVYEDFLLGFSQLTYQPENFPVRTTVSLLQGKEGFKVSSHLKLQPSEQIVLNLYSEERNQKFDFNWSLLSGLTLTADGSSKTESLRAGARITYKSELFSFLAKAQLDNNNELQWEVKSNLGDLKLNYKTNTVKTNTEIKYDFDTFANSGFQCSLFFNNQTHQRNQKEDSLAVWGWNLHSTDEIANNRYHWEINLGYGLGSEGAGAIASMGVALESSLSLKLSYEEVSLSSDTTQIKLQLSSN